MTLKRGQLWRINGTYVLILDLPHEAGLPIANTQVLLVTDRRPGRTQWMNLPLNLRRFASAARVEKLA